MHTPAHWFARMAVIAIVMIAAVVDLDAQPTSGDIHSLGGTSYVIAYPDTTTNLFDARFPNTRFADKIYAFVYSAVENEMSIRGNGYNRPNVVIPAGQFKIIEFTDPAYRAPHPIVTESGIVSRNTFRIDAEAPVVVYCYLVTKFGTEAWTPLPVDAWGKEYTAAMLRSENVIGIIPATENTVGQTKIPAPSTITIIAAYDNTSVQITPTGTTEPWQPLSIVLDSGEAYTVTSKLDTNVSTDLAGSRIVATKPVGVITGNTRVMGNGTLAGLAGNSAKNMQLEWLSPHEQHGREFAYLPSWDARRLTGVSGENAAEKRPFELVRIYNTSKQTATGMVRSDSATRTIDIVAGGVFTDTIRVAASRYYRFDRAVQAMMSSTATVKFNGTTNGWNGFIGAQYDMWGGHMTEMVPRERWTSFAPYYASVHPPGMERMINVVTDTLSAGKIRMEDGSLFPFTWKIAGTDLIWGTATVVAGRDHYLKGENGARFHAVVYGVYKGHEEYRPGSTRKDDDATTLGRRVSSDGVVMHPSEYEEYLGVAYSHPVAASRYSLQNGDSLRIDSSTVCGDLTLAIAAVNPNPAGLHSIRLDSATNTRIATLSPLPLGGSPTATITISTIDRSKDASATIVIVDRTGKSTTVRYTHFIDRVTVAPSGTVSYGELYPWADSTIVVSITNPLPRDLSIARIGLVFQGRGFELVDTISFPRTLKPGESVTVRVLALNDNWSRLAIDTLRLDLPCRTQLIPLRARMVVPVVDVDDLDFGTVNAGDTATLKLRICNAGDGLLNFWDSTGKMLEWSDRSFRISAGDLDRLRLARLPSDSCIEVTVEFTGTGEGVHETVARFFTNSGSSRDTSVWRVRVVRTTAVRDGGNAGYRLGAALPNPASGRVEIPFALGRSSATTITLHDVSGRHVATLLDRRLDAGEHTLFFDAAALAAGTYYYRIESGGWSGSGTVTVR